MNARDLKVFLEQQEVRLWLEDGSLKYAAPPGVLSARLLEEMRARKSELISIMHERQGMAPRSAIMPALEQGEPHPLSFAQHRLWFLDELLSEQAPHLRAAHNNPLALSLRGDLDVSRLSDALQAVVDRHSALRTKFGSIDGVPNQIVTAEATIDLPFVDISDRPCVGSALRKIEEAELVEPLDLATGRPFRFMLVRRSHDLHLLIVILHHIVSDGWSMEVFTNDLMRLYAAGSLEQAKLPPLPFEFVQYARWQRDEAQRETVNKCLAYWRRKLEGASFFFSLPEDDARPANQSYVTDAVSFELGKAETHDLRRLCQQNRTTLFTGLLGAFQVLLAKFCGEKDVVVATANAGRTDLRLEEILGYFANTLVLRTQVDETESFVTHLRAARETVIDAEAHQAAPFEQLVEEFQPQRNFAHAPLCQIFFVLQIAEASSQTAGGLSWTSEVISNPFSAYDLTFYVRDTAEGLKGSLRYTTDLYRRATMDSLLGAFALLIKKLAREPERQLSTISLCDPDLPTSVLDGGAVERSEVLPRAFEAQAGATPTATAIELVDRSLTYKEVNERANRIARRLQAENVGPGKIVAICLDRCADLVPTLLAVAKTGAAYLPLDPDTPVDRIMYILDDADVDLTIADSPRLPDSAGVKTMRVDDDLDGWSSTDIDVEIDPEQLAYLIYTSGSTGRPKGVMVTHGNLASLLADMVRRLPITSEDRLVAITTITFDIAGLELYGPLLVGGTVVLAQRDTISDGEMLGALINERGTIVQATPTGWAMLLDCGWRRPPRLKVVSGGEALRPDILTRLTEDGGEVWNVYGPTETTIWSTAVKLAHGQRVSIGKPIRGTCAYVCDDCGAPVPLGAIGTLLLGGAGVAKGYWRRPELTAERFRSNALNDGIVYNTGDKVRQRHDGCIEFLGRNDDQIKIRGYRIEPGEIEAVLADEPSVGKVAVVPHTSTSGDTRLIAYVVPQNEVPSRKLDVSLLFFSGNAERVGSKPLYDLYQKAALKADKLGFNAVWTPERHFHPVGGLYPNPAVLAANLALQTKAISLRAGSIVLPLHDPIRVVEEWSVVDNLSNGRVEVAFAAGWNAQDFALRPSAFADRRGILESSVAAVRELWRGEPSRRGAVNGEIETFPRPRQAELPIWITASNSVETFELAGKLGLNVLTHLLGQTIDELAGKLRAYRIALADHGWPPHQGRVAIMVHTFLLPEPGEARRQSRAPFKEYLRGHVALDRSRLDEAKANDDEALDELLELSVDRYFADASLIGDFTDGASFLNKMRHIGIDEIACLIDFGVADNSVLAAMDNITELFSSSVVTASVDLTAIAAGAARRLPSYMRPSAYVALDDLPRTGSGKTDRRALSAVPPPADSVKSSSRTPNSVIEQDVANIWADVLGAPPAGVHDDFFVQGGHSLLASQLVSRLRRKFQRQLPLRSIFEKPTVAGISAALSDAPSLLAERPGIDAGDRTGPAPLSPQQRRIWRFVASRPDLPPIVHTKSRAWWLRGGVDPVRLKEAMTVVAEEHDLLRTEFFVNGGDPKQRVGSTVSSDLLVYVRRPLSRSQRLAAVYEEARNEATIGFDLTTSNLIRLRFVEFDESEGMLLLTHHALLMDGWSTEIFVEELIARLNEVPTKSPGMRYVDYARAQQAYRESEDYGASLAYWSKTLAGAPATSLPPSDRPRLDRPRYAGNRVEFAMDADMVRALEALSREEGATLFMTLACALMLSLSNWTGQEDVTIGTLAGGRAEPELEHVIGFFANTLVLRGKCDNKISFREHLRIARDTILAAFAHQQTPYEDMVASFPAVPMGADPGCQVLLVVHNQPSAAARGRVTIDSIDLPTLVSRYELCFALTQIGDEMVGAIEYASEMFDDVSVATLRTSWMSLLRRVLSSPDLPNVWFEPHRTSDGAER